MKSQFVRETNRLCSEPTDLIDIKLSIFNFLSDCLISE